MEDLNLEYMLLAMLGMIIHICLKVIDRKRVKGEDKFSFRKFFADRMNWFRIILSISSVVALMIMADDLSDMLGITLTDGSPAKEVFAFMAGYLNHSLIRNVLKSFKNKEIQS